VNFLKKTFDHAKKNIGSYVAATLVAGSLVSYVSNELSYDRTVFNHDGQEYICFEKNDQVQFRINEPGITRVKYIGTSEGFDYALQEAPVRGIGMVSISEGNRRYPQMEEEFNSILTSYNNQ
jgi:hypothetical protein